jgi:hypothetical protein
MVAHGLCELWGALRHSKDCLEGAQASARTPIVSLTGSNTARMMSGHQEAGLPWQHGSIEPIAVLILRGMMMMRADGGGNEYIQVG